MGSGYKSFSSASVLTAADLNNYCQSQSVMYFATTTARDTAITSPQDGMVAYIGSNDSSEGLYTYNGTSWRKGPGWNAPWGIISYTSDNSVQSSSSTTYVDIPNITWTGTPVANRLYRATVACRVQANGTTGQAYVAIRNGSGTALIKRQQNCSPLYAPDNICFSYTWTTSAVSTTIKLSFYANSGTSILVVGGTGEETTMHIEDLGPSGAPV